jgi:hypothetical protein
MVTMRDGKKTKEEENEKEGGSLFERGPKKT